MSMDEEQITSFQKVWNAILAPSDQAGKESQPEDNAKESEA